MKHVDENIRDRLHQIMAYEGNKVIKYKDFHQIILPMACFSATDINNDNELDANEVKTLFWLFDGKKPSMEKI